MTFTQFEIDFADSAQAAANAFDASPLNTVQVAMNVATELRERREKAVFVYADTDSMKLKTPSLLGCYVNGLLKFQSRDHEAIYDYARKNMSDGHNVWVAPVGSFVDAKAADTADAKKTRRIKKAS